ncbi:mitochondrial import inner membrane translocase subunit Tim29-like [Topomyia yanbarensis]|uniref:mitochondrial import inner membrane translocase subunit Tim29-like n=1 Tax=Topomyia yanbarensis TaxID=2498891 RepID=UPI00273B2F8C|nr:mitochondrial import inner membrane translocase subunit Tim29-like [Topomyia yanbarensis]XP_058840613.1 mitochondrial import inner membrane translocase subunit Tim29-like [Topomyia yanbarensis]
MAYRKIRFASSFARNNLESLKEKRAALQNRLDALEFPEKYKGTIWEKWAKYWKNLFIDYKEVVIDTGRTMHQRPVRSGIYLTLLGSGYYCCANNPDESDFLQRFRNCENELSLVHTICQNPETVAHILFLQRAFNEGIIRRISLGVVSFIWLDNFDRGVAIYKAICPYLQPRYLTFWERIIDVGFNNEWWMLKKKMVDYDVNEENI